MFFNCFLWFFIFFPGGIQVLRIGSLKIQIRFTVFKSFVAATPNPTGVIGWFQQLKLVPLAQVVTKHFGVFIIQSNRVDHIEPYPNGWQVNHGWQTQTWTMQRRRQPAGIDS